MEHSPSTKTNLTIIAGHLKMAMQLLSTSLKKPDFTTDNVFRVFHGFAPDTPTILKSLTIDLYKDTLLVQRQQNAPLEEDLQQWLLANCPYPEKILYKARYIDQGKFAYQTVVLRGSNTDQKDLVVCEQGLFYQAKLTNSLDTGLYLDTREVRTFLHQHVQNQRILNLYSYTGSLGVAAMKGNAKDVIHVDNSKTALQQAKQNYELNQIKINPRSFCLSDVKEFLRHAVKKKDLYDIVIIDRSPPTNHFKDSQEAFLFYISPLQKCAQLLPPKGKLLFSCYHLNELGLRNFEEALQKALPKIRNLQTIPYPNPFNMPIPKMFLIELSGKTTSPTIEDHKNQ